MYRSFLVRSRLLSGFFFWERGSRSVDPMCSLYNVYLFLVDSRFGFEGRIWALIVQVPGHCLHVAFTVFTIYMSLYMYCDFCGCKTKIR